LKFEEIPMRFVVAAHALAATIIAASAPAAATNCYVIVDRGNEVVYQDVTSPIDLSDEGSAARDALRRRGEQLVAMDTDRCPAIDRARLAGRSGPASVEEIVAGMRPAVPFGAGAAGARRTSSDAGGIVLPRITVPRATGGGLSTGGPPSGMSIRY
jgi:hypothetical protein